MRWIDDAAVDRFTGSGLLVTDNRPLPEYFLLRRIFNQGEHQVGPGELRSLTRG